MKNETICHGNVEWGRSFLLYISEHRLFIREAKRPDIKIMIARWQVKMLLMNATLKLYVE